MSERLLIVLLWNVLHGTIHRRAARAFPWGRNLPRRHFFIFFLSRFFGFFAILFNYQLPPWFLVKSDVDWTVRWEGCTAYIGPGCLRAPGPTSAHSQVSVQRMRRHAKHRYCQQIYFTRSLGALRALTSSCWAFGPFDFVLRALRALRPCDSRNSDWIVC